MPVFTASYLVITIHLSGLAGPAIRPRRAKGYIDSKYNDCIGCWDQEHVGRVRLS